MKKFVAAPGCGPGWLVRVGLIFLFMLPLPTVVAQTKEGKTVERAMTVEEVNGQPEINVSFPEIFTTKLRERVSSGFSSRILIGVQIVSTKDGESVAQGITEYIVIYDIWDERFGLRELWPKTLPGPLPFEELMAQYRMLGRRAKYRNTHQISNLEHLIAICGSLRHFPLTWQSKPTADMKLTAYVRVEINPISDDQMKKVGDYLSNPDGPTRQKPTFFAPSIVNWKKFQADAVYMFRSPPFSMH